MVEKGKNGTFFIWSVKEFYENAEKTKVPNNSSVGCLRREQRE